MEKDAIHCCISMATMVVLMCRNIALYIHCLSCCFHFWCGVFARIIHVAEFSVYAFGVW